MSFYSELTRHYDRLFPPDPVETAFVCSRLVPGPLLDVGCGNGNKTIHLRDSERPITAIDSEPAMVAYARLHYASPEICYELMPMEALARCAPGQFANIVCLGNTLVHAQGPDHISAVLCDFHRISTPGARLIIQILNYDRILDQAITSLPEITGPGLRFRRGYRHSGDFLKFLTCLDLGGSKKAVTHETSLYPLRRAEFETLLLQAGYHSPVWYGGYDASPWRDDSFLCIATATA